MIIATLIVIFIYSVFFDRSKNQKQPGIGVSAALDTVLTAPLCQEARHMEQVAKRAFSPDSNNPRWPLSELFAIFEVYQTLLNYERGDSIDTARVLELEIELEKKLNCLTN